MNLTLLFLFTLLFYQSNTITVCTCPQYTTEQLCQSQACIWDQGECRTIQSDDDCSLIQQCQLASHCYLNYSTCTQRQLCNTLVSQEECEQQNCIFTSSCIQPNECSELQNIEDCNRVILTNKTCFWNNQQCKQFNSCFELTINECSLVSQCSLFNEKCIPKYCSSETNQLECNKIPYCQTSENGQCQRKQCSDDNCDSSYCTLQGTKCINCASQINHVELQDTIYHKCSCGQLQYQNSCGQQCQWNNNKCEEIKVNCSNLDEAQCLEPCLWAEFCKESQCSELQQNEDYKNYCVKQYDCGFDYEGKCTDIPEQCDNLDEQFCVMYKSLLCFWNKEDQQCKEFSGCSYLNPQNCLLFDNCIFDENGCRDIVCTDLDLTTCNQIDGCIIKDQQCQPKDCISQENEQCKEGYCSLRNGYCQKCSFDSYDTQYKCGCYLDQQNCNLNTLNCKWENNQCLNKQCSDLEQNLCLPANNCIWNTNSCVDLLECKDVPIQANKAIAETVCSLYGCIVNPENNGCMKRLECTDIDQQLCYGQTCTWDGTQCEIKKSCGELNKIECEEQYNCTFKFGRCRQISECSELKLSDGNKQKECESLSYCELSGEECIEKICQNKMNVSECAQSIGYCGWYNNKCQVCESIIEQERIRKQNEEQNEEEEEEEKEEKEEEISEESNILEEEQVIKNQEEQQEEEESQNQGNIGTLPQISEYDRQSIQYNLETASSISQIYGPLANLYCACKSYNQNSCDKVSHCLWVNAACHEKNVESQQPCSDKVQKDCLASKCYFSNGKCQQFTGCAFLESQVNLQQAIQYCGKYACIVDDSPSKDLRFRCTEKEEPQSCNDLTQQNCHSYISLDCIWNFEYCQSYISCASVPVGICDKFTDICVVRSNTCKDRDCMDLGDEQECHQYVQCEYIDGECQKRNCALEQNIDDCNIRKNKSGFCSWQDDQCQECQHLQTNLMKGVGILLISYALLMILIQ